MDKIKNRVSESQLKIIDLSDFYPSKAVVAWDIKPLLVQEQILMEKYFREKLDGMDFSSFQGKIVAVHCSVDALIPNWAYMLIASKFMSVQAVLLHGDLQSIKNKLLIDNLIKNLNPEQYAEQQVILKGCGKAALTPEAYLKASEILLPHVKSLMYGEPCSTVPIYKKK